jgi:AraC-like DNA-binding protein
MQQMSLEATYSRIIIRPKPILVWVNWARKKDELAEKIKDTELANGVTISNWRVMIEELLLAGYSLTKIAKLIGMSRRSVQRWFNNPEEIASPRLFAGILYLYCHHRMEMDSSKRSFYANQPDRN